MAYKISRQHLSPFSQTLNVHLSSGSLVSYLVSSLSSLALKESYPPLLNVPKFISSLVLIHAPPVPPLGNSSQTSHLNSSSTDCRAPHCVSCQPSQVSLCSRARSSPYCQPLPAHLLFSGRRSPSPPPRSIPAPSGRIRTVRPSRGRREAPGRFDLQGTRSTLKRGETPWLVGSEPCTTP